MVNKGTQRGLTSFVFILLVLGGTEVGTGAGTCCLGALGRGAIAIEIETILSYLLLWITSVCFIVLVTLLLGLSLVVLVVLVRIVLY